MLCRKLHIYKKYIKIEKYALVSNGEKLECYKKSPSRNIVINGTSIWF